MNRLFAEHNFQNYLYVNFEEDIKNRTLFDRDLDPKRLLSELELLYDVKIEKGKSLIIFDEIQACPNALNSLKYFNEQIPEYHIAAAGFSPRGKNGPG
ncbi:AAA family ATPase [Candidatus Margulisiibacteriota bacterium]